MDKKNAVIRRLRRIEGQIKGIEKMVEDDKFCGDILTQVSAARAALNSAGGLILENYINICIKDHIEENGEENLDKLVETMVKYTKQT